MEFGPPISSVEVEIPTEDECLVSEFKSTRAGCMASATSDMYKITCTKAEEQGERWHAICSINLIEDLFNQLSSASAEGYKPQISFPRKRVVTMFGIPLSPEEEVVRGGELQKWLEDLLTHFDELAPQTQFEIKKLFSFLEPETNDAEAEVAEKVAKEEANILAAEKAQEEAAELAEKEAADMAEKEAAAKAEKEAAELTEKEAAEKAEKEAAEMAEKEAAEKAAKEAAEMAEKEASEKAEQEAAEQAEQDRLANEAAQQEAADKAAKEAADNEAAEKAEAERKAAEEESSNAAQNAEGAEEKVEPVTKPQQVLDYEKALADKTAMSVQYLENGVRVMKHYPGRNRNISPKDKILILSCGKDPILTLRQRATSQKGKVAHLKAVENVERGHSRLAASDDRKDKTVTISTNDYVMSVQFSTDESANQFQETMKYLRYCGRHGLDPKEQV
mmetsp:Transcript_7611/g.11576  ORF Transcript_7611/g.11576 Transcript_7611/m.11576 type:complete len:448 (-) Transcript_7611:265-1608(-)